MRLLTPSLVGFANLSTLSPNRAAIPPPKLRKMEEQALKQKGESLLAYHSSLPRLSTLLTRLPSPNTKHRTQNAKQTYLPHIILPPQIIYSPNDLITYYNSDIMTWLARFRVEQRAYGLDAIEKTKIDESGMLFINKGIKHEDDYLAQLRDEGKNIIEIPTFHSHKDMTFKESYDLTIQAMQEGPEVIYQAALQSGQFAGYADFLIRVDNPPGIKNKIGDKKVDYHYEVWDTKLSRSPQMSCNCVVMPICSKISRVFVRKI